MAAGPDPKESGQNLQKLQQLAALRDEAAHRALTEDEQAELETLQVSGCMHCGGIHARACPRVRRVVFNPQTGALVEVEYWPGNKIDWTGVVFEDVGGASEDQSWVADWDIVLQFLEQPPQANKLQRLGDQSNLAQAVRRLVLLSESFHGGV